MATEYVISGPTVMDITKVSSTPEHTLGVPVKTAELGSNKVRGYQYVKFGAAHTAGTPYYISSTNDLLFAASNGAGLGLEIGVPQATVSSPVGNTYGFVQTDGYFDNTGAFAGVGILAASATVGSEMYLTGTAGSMSTVPAAIVVPVGARALSNGSAANVYAFAPTPLRANKDLLA
jgi:hypothetical protein